MIRCRGGAADSFIYSSAMHTRRQLRLGSKLKAAIRRAKATRGTTPHQACVCKVASDNGTFQGVKSGGPPSETEAGRLRCQPGTTRNVRGIAAQLALTSTTRQGWPSSSAATLASVRAGGRPHTTSPRFSLDDARGHWMREGESQPGDERVAPDDGPMA